MAISRVKTWVAEEVLDADDQNAEFDNILDNALTLVSPWTGNITLASTFTCSPAITSFTFSAGDTLLLNAAASITTNGSLNLSAATTFTLGWKRDNKTQQTESLTQSGTATLGPSDDEFTLDIDTLGGGTNLPAFATTMAGSFKALQLQLSQSAAVDFEPHGLELEFEIERAVSHALPVG